MAFILIPIFLVPLLSFPTYATTPTSQTHPHHQVYEKHYPNGAKSLRFTLYLQETVNKTAYFIVKGVTGPKHITKTSNPFGSIFAFHDPLTVTPDPTSEVLGTTEGSAVTSSMDGERTTCLSSMSLWVKGYKGSVLNIGVADYVKNSELPMAGGTGDFRYVQGYIATSVVNLSGHTTCYKIDFFLYWPPYAAMFHE